MKLVSVIISHNATMTLDEASDLVPLGSPLPADTDTCTNS